MLKMGKKGGGGEVPNWCPLPIQAPLEHGALSESQVDKYGEREAESLLQSKTHGGPQLLGDCN